MKQGFRNIESVVALYLSESIIGNGDHLWERKVLHYSDQGIGAVPSEGNMSSE
jgi:hypothetical protein